MKRWNNTQIFDKMIESEGGRWVFWEDVVKLLNNINSIGELKRIKIQMGIKDEAEIHN